DYASDREAMHACGHDMHVAGLVGAAHLINSRRHQLRGSVILMFQPGEEIGDGAIRMIDEGVLAQTGTSPIAAYGIHIVPGEYGIFSTRPGALMAGAIDLDIVVKGRGGHASAPHLTADPIPAVAAIITSLQVFVTR